MPCGFPESLSISESLAFAQQVCSRSAGSTGVLVSSPALCGLGDVIVVSN